MQRLNILKKRLERAEKLLAESDKSIGEIGEICGFGFYSEFALFLKKDRLDAGLLQKRI